MTRPVPNYSRRFFVNRIPKLLGLVLLLALAMLAPPSFAAQSQNKTMTLQILTGETDTTHTLQPGQVQATITNTSPTQSNSTFGSVDLFVDLNWSFSSITATASGVPVSSKNINPGNPKNTPPGHIRISNVGPVKPGNSLVITFLVSGGSGDGTFNANVWSGSSFSGNLFTQTAGQNIGPVATDSLACNGGGTGPEVPMAGDVVATRGEWNKDGTVAAGQPGDPCNPAPIFVSNTFNNNVGLQQNIVHFRWNVSGTGDTFPTAAFAYDIYTSSAPSSKLVGWLYQDGTLAINAGANPNANTNTNGPNPVVFIEAPPCLNPQAMTTPPLPSPYGSLASGLDASTAGSTDSIFFVGDPPASPPPTNFPIQIGLERMLVTSTTNDNGSWTVTRGDLQDAGSPTPAHPSDETFQPLIMSTPLPPIDTTPAAYVLQSNGTLATPSTNPYEANTVAVPHAIQAQMCLFTSGTSENGVPFVTIIDIGDGWGVPR
jgi:hypothetical protein